MLVKIILRQSIRRFPAQINNNNDINNNNNNDINNDNNNNNNYNNDVNNYNNNDVNNDKNNDINNDNNNNNNNNNNDVNNDNNNDETRRVAATTYKHSHVGRPTFYSLIQALFYKMKRKEMIKDGISIG